MKIHHQSVYLAVIAFVALPSIHAETFPGPDLFESSVQIDGRLTLSSNDGAVFTGNYGYGALAPSGAGVRMLWNPYRAAFRAGYVGGNSWDSANLGAYSFAAGYNTLASGNGAAAFGINSSATGYYSSFAAGYNATASGSESTSLGYYTFATGSASVAMGSNTQATGYVSLATNASTIAGGNYSTSMGYVTTANSFASMSVGRYNVIQGNPSMWVEADPLFVVGNGTGNVTHPVEV